MSDPLPLEWDCASCLALRAEIERHIREKVELAGLVAKERARIERLEAALQRIADMCPATAELTLAHEMADNAMAALGGVDDDTY